MSVWPGPKITEATEASVKYKWHLVRAGFVVQKQHSRFRGKGWDKQSRTSEGCAWGLSTEADGRQAVEYALASIR